MMGGEHDLSAHRNGAIHCNDEGQCPIQKGVTLLSGFARDARGESVQEEGYADTGMVWKLACASSMITEARRSSTEPTCDISATDCRWNASVSIVGNSTARISCPVISRNHDVMLTMAAMSRVLWDERMTVMS